MEVGCGENAACGGGEGVLRRCAGTPHPPLAGAPSPQGEDFRATFFYKPIDIVGFMCYHALTYKKDMLKE